MIPVSFQSSQPETWQIEMQSAVRNPADLLAYLGLDYLINQVPEYQGSDFNLKVPQAFVNRMVHGDANDPLLLQVLPLLAELQDVDGFVSEPLQESGHFVPTRGMIKKYAGRALIMATGVCAIHCRYCFRRNFPYQENMLTPGQLERISGQIRQNQLGELIFSGGDPLSLSTKKLAETVGPLLENETVHTLRFHSRTPVVLPSRLNASFCNWWNGLATKKVMVLHVNHANEINDDVRLALAGLKNTTLLNQSVLLKGINDSVKSQVELSYKLHQAGVLPYYLHLLDPVKGAAHFDISEADAVELMAEVRSELPGYLVPRLVREKPGESSKTVIA